MQPCGTTHQTICGILWAPDSVSLLRNRLGVGRNRLRAAAFRCLPECSFLLLHLRRHRHLDLQSQNDCDGPRAIREWKGFRFCKTAVTTCASFPSTEKRSTWREAAGGGGMTHRAAGAVGRRRSARAGRAKRGLLRRLPGQLRRESGTAQRQRLSGNPTHWAALCYADPEFVCLAAVAAAAAAANNLLSPPSFRLSPLSSPFSCFSSLISSLAPWALPANCCSRHSCCAHLQAVVSRRFHSVSFL